MGKHCSRSPRHATMMRWSPCSGGPTRAEIHGLPLPRLGEGDRGRLPVELLRVRILSLVEGPAHLLGLVGVVVVRHEVVDGDAAHAEHAVVAGVERGLERGQGLRPALLELLAHSLGARTQLCVSHHFVDEPEGLGLLRAVLAIEVPDLPRALAAHRVLEIPGAEARIVGAHHGPTWRKVACSLATVRSHMLASTLPPPTAKPLTMAITGTGMRSMRP